MGNDLIANPVAQAQERLDKFEPYNDRHEIPSRDPLLLDHDEITVRRLPERLNSDEGRALFQQVQKLLSATQPHFVFDFSQVRELDAAGIHLLLQCLEEVMKVNGDVKLAAVPCGPAAVLEQTGVDGLFEIFDSTADAVQSFHYVHLHDWTIEVPLSTNPVTSDAAPGAYGAD